MPLRNNTLYTIHNDLTHTVLDMSGQYVGTPTSSTLACNSMLTLASLARGWGWHGDLGQQVGDEAWLAG